MSNPISLPVIINSLATKVDGSIKIVLETREFSPKESSVLFELRGKEAWAILSESELKDSEIHIPDERPDPSIGTKTPSQRLRNVLYRLWEQQSSGTDFESFYRIKMDGIIEKLKERLDA